jgi:TonB family protein
MGFDTQAKVSMRIVTVACIVVSAGIGQEPSTQPRAATTSEYGLRRSATVMPMPEYPAASVTARASGVAVASITFGTTGRTEIVDVLQAPDAHIDAAVKDALMRWEFTPLTGPDGVTRFAVRSKLTFYFQIEGGKGRVLHPHEMPGGESLNAELRPRAQPPSSGGPPPAKPIVRDVGHEPVDVITFAQLQKLSGAARPTILDVGDRAAFKRGHTDGAVNLPVDEVAVRARIELRGVPFIAIDCTQEQEFRCKAAAHMLGEGGFKRIALLRR